MPTFDELYGAWMAADESAKEAEAEVYKALKAVPVVPAHLHNNAVALRGIANRLLEDTMDRMREDAKPRAPRTSWLQRFLPQPLTAQARPTR